jgi:hypothetical protein
MTAEQFVHYVRGIANNAVATGTNVDPQHLLSAANAVVESRQSTKTQLND